MKLNIAVIADSIGTEFEFKEEINIKSIVSVNGEFSFAKPVLISGTVSNIDGTYKLLANINAEYLTNCNRCNNKTKFNFSLDISENLSKNPVSDDFEPVIQNEINLEEIIEKNFIANVPYLHLCKNDCKGLCQKCGQDLNEKACSCKDEYIDPRFSVLDDLFK